MVLACDKSSVTGPCASQGIGNHTTPVLPIVAIDGLPTVGLSCIKTVSDDNSPSGASSLPDGAFYSHPASFRASQHGEASHQGRLHGGSGAGPYGEMTAAKSSTCAAATARPTANLSRVILPLLKLIERQTHADYLKALHQKGPSEPAHRRWAKAGAALMKAEALQCGI